VRGREWGAPVPLRRGGGVGGACRGHSQALGPLEGRLVPAPRPGPACCDRAGPGGAKRGTGVSAAAVSISPAGAGAAVRLEPACGTVGC